MKQFIILLLLILSLGQGYGQAESVSLTEHGQHEYSWTYFSYSSLLDRNDAPYVYSASNVLGCVIFDVSDLDQPIPIDTLSPSQFNSHDVSNLYQENSLLYLALGNFQSAFVRRPGLAIVDVSDPSAPLIEAVWDTTAFDNGCAIVRVVGDYAYLGLMDEGVLILDISDRNAIHAVGHIVPDPTFPHTIPYAPNARGMEIRGDYLYLAYDAGGLRIIDISDKSNPVEVHQYMNPDLDSIAQPAYNNIRLVGDYAFIAVDYCGLEIVDISDPTDVQTVAWYNPWDCNGASWFGSPGHSNELITAQGDSLLFMSGGDTELHVLDISDPTHPKLLAEFGIAGDSVVAWGVDVWGEQIVLSLIDNSFFWTPIQPYYGDQGGIRLLSWESDMTTLAIAQPIVEAYVVFPNPTHGLIHIQPTAELLGQCILELWSLDGQRLLKDDVFLQENVMFPLDLREYSAGTYLLRLRHKSGVYTQRFLKLSR